MAIHNESIPDKLNSVANLLRLIIFPVSKFEETRGSDGFSNVLNETLTKKCNI